MHNFFVLANKLRFKHAYYGHKHEHAFTAPLGAMNADINLLVKCAQNISDEGNQKQRIVPATTTLKRTLYSSQVS